MESSTLSLARPPRIPARPLVASLSHASAPGTPAGPRGLQAGGVPAARTSARIRPDFCQATATVATRARTMGTLATPAGGRARAGGVGLQGGGPDCLASPVLVPGRGGGWPGRGTGDDLRVPLPCTSDSKSKIGPCRCRRFSQRVTWRDSLARWKPLPAVLEVPLYSFACQAELGGGGCQGLSVEAHGEEHLQLLFGQAL